MWNWRTWVSYDMGMVVCGMGDRRVTGRVGDRMGGYGYGPCH